MFAGIKNAGALFSSIIRVPFRYPVLLVPLFFVWAAYAPVLVYMKFYFPWETVSLGVGLAAAFGFIFLLSYLISLSAFMLLEQIRMIENGSSPSVAWPVRVAFWNSIRALHVTLIWALLWFAITVAEMLVRRGRSDAGADEPTPENVAKLLGGYERFSLSAAFLDALKKGVRMIAFLIYPAIAWEGHDRPIRRGLSVARTHKTAFASGFVLTDIAAAVVFLPPAIVFMLSEKTDVAIGDTVWFAVILYCGFAWSFSILIEQLFTAELYLWDLNWRRECDAAEAKGGRAPALGDVKRPSILDDHADMTPG